MPEEKVENINPDRLFDLAKKWGQRKDKPPIFSDQYLKRLKADVKRFMDVKSIELDSAEIVCSSCMETYPHLPDLDTCPYCDHDDAHIEVVVPKAIEVVEVTTEEEEENPLFVELERSKEQMLHECLDEIEELGKKSIKALWQIGKCFLLIKQNKLHLKDDLNVIDFNKWCEIRTGWHCNTVDKLIRFHKTIPIEIIENAKRIQVSGLLAIDKVAKIFPTKKKEIMEQTVEHIGQMPKTTRYKHITVKEARTTAKEIARKVLYAEDGTISNQDEVGIAILSKGYMRKASIKNYYGKNTKSIVTKVPITYKVPFILDSYDKKTVEKTPFVGRKLEIIFPATNSLLELEITDYGAIAVVKQTGKRLHHQLIPEGQKLYNSLEDACEDKDDGSE